jgi:class 3 adenylate cyclase
MAEDLAGWLESLGLGQYARAFADNDIDLDILPDIDDADLEKLGLSMGHRKKLMRAIAALSGGAAATQPATAAGPAVASPGAEAERRQLSVLFCDLVGSTALSASLDPEDMREVLRAYQDACAAVIARFDGYVAKFMGDGVVACFGYPRAHEDDAERAVNAALGLVEAVGALRRDLKVRIGVATGTVAVGDIVGEGASQEAAIIGEAPNLAARLQELAEPDSVVISAATRRLVGGLFETAELGARALKGFPALVPAWTVVRPNSAPSRFQAIRGERLTALVGREEELDMLRRRWQRAKAGHGQLVLISGEAGIGKSRLVHAFRESIAAEPHLALAVQCSPYHDNSALHPILQNVERRMGLSLDDTPAARLDKLDAWIAEGHQAPDEVAPVIGPLLGIDTAPRYAPRYAPRDIPPQRRKELLFWVLNDRMAKALLDELE